MTTSIRIRNGMEEYRLTLGSNVLNGNNLLSLLKLSKEIPIYSSTRMWIGGHYIPKDTILIFGDEYVLIMSDEWGEATVENKQVPTLDYIRVDNPVIFLD